jgi:hypothetical protein
LVTSAAQAAALVLASNQKFDSVRARDHYLAGQPAWYEAVETADGYSVTVMLGYGDCPAGCIHRHTWRYEVARDGGVRLVSDEGEDLEFPSPSGSDETATVHVNLVAGPTCPVEHKPPDPSCAPRPVADTAVVLRDPAGHAVRTAKSDDEGAVTLSVPGGAYYLEPAAVEGLMGQAQPVAFSVAGGATTVLTLAYDTGIR